MLLNMNLIRLFSLSSFCHTDYWWYRHQVEVLPFHNAAFHSCGSLIWSKAEPHLEILWGRLAFGVRILHWSPPLFDICPIRPTTSEIWSSSTSGFDRKHNYNLCVFGFFLGQNLISRPNGQLLPVAIWAYNAKSIRTELINIICSGVLKIMNTNTSMTLIWTWRWI